MTTLVLVFKKIESGDKTKYDTFHSNPKAKNNYQWKWHWWCISINLYYNYFKPLGKDSGLIIKSVIDTNISISDHNPLAGSSYINLKKELNQPNQGLTNIQIYWP